MLKHVFCPSLIFLCIFQALCFADEHFPFLAVVSKDSVNVRAGPNTNFEKVDKLNKGDQVVVLGRDYEWYKVQLFPTTKSFIRSDYLRQINGGDLAEVLGDNVNVRSSPNADAASLGEVKRGTIVEVLGQVNNWCRLAPVAGTRAWVHQDFLKVKSWDVPYALLINPIKTPNQNVSAQTAAVAMTTDGIPAGPLKAATAGVSPWVSLRGTVEALVQPPLGGVHYEIVMDNKSVFLLQDIPNIAFFCNALVDLQGALVPDPQKKLMYPLLHINKIVLVL